jgi:hypothetical protein
MRKKISICLLAMAITLGTYYIAYGVSSFKTQFNTRYGTTGTAIDQCILCHATNNGPNIPSTETPPNPYGVALENNGLNFAAVESLDSDGDGFNNITEINARTFPGNSASRPAAGDTTAPTVTAFSIPATSSSLSVPITAFAATDNIGVTGYMVNESSTKPLATAAGWTASAPASYTASAAGARTLYAWAKDAAGNVSNSRSASTTITLSQPTQGPTFSNPTAITNRYLPLANLNQDILEGTMGGQVLHVERTLMGNTKNFKVGNQTVATLIVEERSFVDNVLQEVSLGYFAQADDGTVYSFGEKVNVYDSSGQVVGHQGSWQYGVDTNQLGITMPAYSQSRSRIRFRPQDNVPAVTIPNATVARVWRMTVPAGRFRRCLRITETLSDGTVEHRYYAPNVGLIKEVFPGGELSLISHNQPAENNIENDIENNLENNIENDAQK